MKLQDLKEQRAAKVADMRAINEKALAANRDLDDGEREAFDKLGKEIRSLTDQIDRADKLAEFERLEAPGEPVGGPEMQREMRNYSLAKAIRESHGDRLTGREAEVHDELAKGREVRGVMVPTEVLLDGAETRALLTSGTSGNLVQTELTSMTDRRRPALKIESMGATILRGLNGNIELPRLTSSGTSHWIAEHTDTTRSDATFEKKPMGPKTVSAEYEVSRRMLLQSNEALEPILRRDLNFILAQALDLAAIKGGGTNEPTGIMADANVTEMTGAAVNSDTTADMIAELEIDDVTGTRAFLTHPGVLKIARKLNDGDGLPIPLATTFHNERVENTTQVPVVTAGTPDTYAMIFGEWASLYLGYWSGVDLLLNPYHTDVASKGGALLHAFLDADIVVRHPEGFRWMEITG